LILNKTGVKTLKSNVNQVDDDGEPVPATLDDVLPTYPSLLKKELNSSGFGNAIFYEESDQPLTANYVNLSQENYEYLDTKLNNLKDNLISRSKIPRERYMLNDIKESMNSQKTVAFWEIYTKYLASLQGHEIIPVIRNILEIIYGVTFKVSLTVPEFEEIKNSRINEIRENFKTGLITFGEAITEIANIEGKTVNLDENPLFDEYFYNGQPMNLLSGVEPINEDLQELLQQIGLQ